MKVISESLLSGNCFHAGRHCATTLSEQLRCKLALLTSQICFAFVAVSLRRNSDIISCVFVCVNTFLRFFISLFSQENFPSATLDLLPALSDGGI